MYVLGPPGSGKSSALAGALTAVGCTSARPAPGLPLVPYLVHDPGDIIELGRRRPLFSGTDALPLNVAPAALAWLADRPPARLVAEGDRLAFPAFFDALAAAYGAPAVVYLDCPAGLAHDRARRRAEAEGRPVQPLSWWLSRSTKARRLARSYATVTVDATRPLTAVIADLAAVVAAQTT